MSGDAWLDDLDDVLLARAEEGDQAEAVIAIALAGGQEIEIDEDELNGAVKRSLFVLAAGGDPSRGVDLQGRAVETIAEDLDSPFRRKILMGGLQDLRARAGQRAGVGAVVSELESDDELAWRAFAAARMVQLLAQDG